MQFRVLVVEDDEILRWLMTEAVTHLGHAVIQCPNADQALLQLADSVAFDLVITDVRMPGQADGMELAKVIWSTQPQLPVIIVSGHMVPKPGLLPANARFIAKPCSLELLSNAIDDLVKSR